MVKVVIPQLAEGIDKVTISYWYFKEGDRIKKDDDIVEVVTDKATFNIPSPCDGILQERLFKESETVSVGEVIALIEEI